MKDMDTPFARDPMPIRYHIIHFSQAIQFTSEEVARGLNECLPSSPHQLFNQDVRMLMSTLESEVMDVRVSCIYENLVVYADALYTIQKYLDLDWLNPLFSATVHETAPDHRVDSAGAARKHFGTIKKNARLTGRSLRWRLRPKSEGHVRRILRDCVAQCKEVGFRLSLAGKWWNSQNL